MNLRWLAVVSLALVSSCSKPAATVEDEEQIVAFVKQGKFAEAEAALDGAHRRCLKDPLTEELEHRAFYVFNRGDRALEQPLNDWVASAPESPYARLARGIYRTKLGWNARGARWARETSQKDMRTMGYWHKLAAEDLNFALARDDSQVMAYLWLIEVDMAQGGIYSDALFEKALELNPLSLTTRWYYSTTLLAAVGRLAPAARGTGAGSDGIPGPQPAAGGAEGAGPL